jgi:hypothetical protein
MCVHAHVCRVERTFRPMSAPNELIAKCTDLCAHLCSQLREEKLKARTITVKLKYAHHKDGFAQGDNGLHVSAQDDKLRVSYQVCNAVKIYRRPAADHLNCHRASSERVSFESTTYGSAHEQF